MTAPHRGEIYYGRDTMRRITAPARWEEPDAEPSRWDRYWHRHERLGVLIGWLATLLWGALCGYAIARWIG